ncbi:MAG TPA: cytochrome c biogenesis protein ResB [Geobacteraceae bacterium]
MTTNKRGFAQTLWDFFCSLKLSIVLLILLAATSIIGTIIPQSPPKEYLVTISEAKFKFYNAMGFFDMYHSWWFILLLYLLTVNLVACSIKRLPRVWKIVSEPTLVMDDGMEKTLSLTHEFKMPKDAASVREKLTAFLAKEFSAPVITEVDGAWHLFSQKTPWCRLGVYVVHLSIIIIFIGALIGSFFGYKAYVNIVEGTSTSTVHSARNEKPIDLGFSVRCDKFSVSFYDTGAPKEFKSLLTIIDNGQPVPGLTSRPTIVNDPLTYKGITFYQSSYGPASEGSNSYLTVRPRKGGEPVKLVVRQGEKTSLPGGGTLEVLESTQEVRNFIPEFSGPAAKVEVTPPNGRPYSFLVFKNYPNLDEQRGGDLIFTYEGSDEKYFTGLQVAHDPGVWVVWSGCILMVVGIMMAFFMSHKRIWVRVANGRIVMGGTASKNPAGFQLAFDALVEKLKQQL